MYARENDDNYGRPLSSWCTLRWKHWAAFLSPYGIRRNLKRPSVVIMAVLSCDASSTCTCWNACRRSILLNTEHPAKRSLKVVSAGRAYLSSLVMAFRRRKSPHTRHEPSGFITACIGDAQLESHRSMTFSASHCLSCSSTCTFFSPWSFLHGEIYWWTVRSDVERCSHGDYLAQTRFGYLRKVSPQMGIFIIFLFCFSNRASRITWVHRRNNREHRRECLFLPGTFQG